jgi:cytochrome c oxidase assembly protein Cox11
MAFMTREVFDLLIIIVILVGLALAAVRLYADFTRPLPPETQFPEEDTTNP